MNKPGSGDQHRAAEEHPHDELLKEIAQRRAPGTRRRVTTSDAEYTAIDRVTQRLSTRFPTLAPAVVEQVVLDRHRRYAEHPNREFVPILVEDAAVDVLRVIPQPRTDCGNNHPETTTSLNGVGDVGCSTPNRCPRPVDGELLRQVELRWLLN